LHVGVDCRVPVAAGVTVMVIDRDGGVVVVGVGSLVVGIGATAGVGTGSDVAGCDGIADPSGVTFTRGTVGTCAVGFAFGGRITHGDGAERLVLSRLLM